MKQIIELNDEYVDIDKISYIGKVDTKVRAHLNTTSYFFTVVIDGNSVNIESDKKEDLVKLRNYVIHEIGSLVENMTSKLGF